MVPDLFRLIGSDRYLTADEVGRAAGPHSATATAWDVYATQFRGFTGSTLDPAFNRLVHPATRTGRVRLDAGTTVVIVGTDASLLPQLDDLVRVRQHVRIFTSSRGAARLAERGIVPDMVIVEYQTASAARLAVRQSTVVGHHRVLPTGPLVAADWRTPSALVADIPPERLFVPTPTLSWGLWQATAVALAAEAKAARVALLGIDAATAAAVPLKALLELIARIVPITALDCVPGTPKRGWVGATVEELAGTKMSGPLETNVWIAPDVREREAQAQRELSELAPTIERARRLLAVAEDARAAGDGASTAALEAAADEIMSWRHNARVRVLMQECLGAAFLARLWRSGVDVSQGLGLRRPLQLAMREVTGRAEALAAAIREERAA